jgi:hypothetical protein
MHSYLTVEKCKEPIHEVLIRSHVVLNSLQYPFCCAFPVLDSILFCPELNKKASKTYLSLWGSSVLVNKWPRSSHSWTAKTHSAAEEILCPYRTWKFIKVFTWHYILSQLNPVYLLAPHVAKIYFNTILLLAPRCHTSIAVSCPD